jgi:ectoine hydroxylase-related dioxygenase (phytanoyl-CoA dioxygenase family)
MPGTNTQFNPLWIDSADAMDQLQARRDLGRLTGELADQIAHLIEYGWVVIPNAISTKLADKLRWEIDNVVDKPDYFLARRGRKAYDHPKREIYNDPTFRLIDYHINSRLARSAVFSPAISRLLHSCFDTGANAFQCLTFHYGSQQAMHQDGAYVVVAEPLQFLASWIALEDISEGTGELAYFSGSHRLDDFIFGEKSKSWNPGVHGEAIHREFIDTLEQRCQDADMPRQTFLPKKGDALIWASDLVHGGSKRTAEGTRQSIVTHYCPIGVDPNFSNFTDYFHPLEVSKNCFVSSRHYDLRPDPVSKQLLRLSREPRYYTPAFMGQTKGEAS